MIINKLRILFVTVLAVGGLVLVAAPHTQAAFNPFGKVCNSDTQDASVCEDAQQTQNSGGENSLYGSNGLLLKAASIVALVAGAASIIVIIIAGLRIVLSSGDANTTKGAKNAILYAVIGLVVAASAQAIIILVLQRL